MGTKIETVDYEAIPRQAKAMRMSGESLNKELLSIYANVEAMHNMWYGKRYNDLVQQFNTMIPSINEVLELVVGKIPFALETVANNYSQVDKGVNVTSATNTSPEKISELAIHNDVGLRYFINEVTETKQKIIDNFKKAENMMNQIESTFDTINWQSEAATEFKAKFKKLKAQITKNFQDINRQFTNQMNLTAEDMSKAENANKVQ